mmetsp:Transcript_17518/g.49494  ORF Transcript_17518/g.49494 Transcript_17518/m.49494 type:complete len:106 (+) Transcript_17518:1373-1690(+)
MDQVLPSPGFCSDVGEENGKFVSFPLSCCFNNDITTTTTTNDDVDYSTHQPHHHHHQCTTRSIKQQEGDPTIARSIDGQQAAGKTSAYNDKQTKHGSKQDIEAIN